MPAGRKPGSKSAMTVLAQAEAKLLGLLPHEWLLKVMRGEPIRQKYTVDITDKNGKVLRTEIHERDWYPQMDARLEAARAAAPYYAPRLATQVIQLRNRSDELGSLSDAQIDEAIRLAVGMKPDARLLPLAAKKEKV
jgi:hypothetical protein